VPLPQKVAVRCTAAFFVNKIYFQFNSEQECGFLGILTCNFFDYGLLQ